MPQTRQAALALARHRLEIKPLLVVLDHHPDKRLAVLECERCGRLWAEDSIMSGHMELPFVYPIQTDYPHHWTPGWRASVWLRQAEPLDC